tara:strand:+ start:66441 stop:69734 length:3294 start_codon:yes stop_codon:yes gene_type:complete
MKTYFHQSIALCLAIFLGAVSSCDNSAEPSKKQFQEIKTNFEIPTDSNTIWCYWYWINDDISKEGVTKDLEAMKNAGIGAALIGNINPDEADGKVPLFSEEWWEIMVYAVSEGKRLGVDIGAFNCPGWSQSGGPWVKPEMAMRYLTYSESAVKGPGVVKVVMKKPYDEFQDIHVLAFPSLVPETKVLSASNAKIGVLPAVLNSHHLIDQDTATIARFSGAVEEYVVDVSSGEMLQARSLKIIPGKDIIKVSCELMAMTEGQYKTIKSFTIDRSKLTPNVGPDKYAPVSISIPETKSDRFLLKFRNLGDIFQSNTYPNPDDNSWGLAEIIISEGSILENYAEKNLGKMHPTPFPAWDSYLWQIQEDVAEQTYKVAPEQVIDLSDKMDDNGLLTWNAPEGEWTIMRIGMTPTGTKNAPAAPQGKGYEVDKMSSELIRFHFDKFVGEFLKRIPEESKSAFKYVIADSYEMGSQNWTDGFEVKFREKYGYDPVKYLPVLSGRIVGSVEESERFLWDLRRAVADDVAHEYVGGLRKVANENNLKLWLENYGHWGFPSEFLMYGGQSDLVSGEFWNEGTLGDIECKASSSAAHIYGKPVTSAEAFTAAFKAYLRHPAELKKRGDWSLAEGINHFVLHLYIQQPDDNRVPGMNAWFSTEFNRHNTWFGQADTYFDYLRRCQHLLQQGKYAADVCYFIGESAPMMTGGRSPEIPAGYSYDYINAEVILDRLTVQNGRFVLPDGMSYRVMVLPPLNTMRPEVLAKLEQLVVEGGVILGPKPDRSPSLQNYPTCDRRVQEIASRLWAGQYTDGKMSHPFGKGYLFDGLGLEEVFGILNISKDVDLGADVPVLWTHRTMPDMDIYFITNQSDEQISINPLFRVNEKMNPQLWDAVTGDVRQLNEFVLTENGTSVPVTLEARQSCFIVFTEIAARGVNKGFKTNFPEPVILQSINSPFSVDFINKAIGPVSPVVFDDLVDWAKSADEKIKYYSGTAVYKTAFNMEGLPADGTCYINLGNVSVMAKAKLNGQDIGGVWIAPYRLNVTGVLQQGQNELEIEVVNLWRNRMIKDKMLPEAEKYTWTVVEDIAEGEQPHSSGLMGPVSIEFIE